uniref:Uncharacterized protein n=1 Tax=Branchiostoma floridae TaxID=7739 RepID=C3Y5Y3_BRAFL|eukprot:XP_002608370.1 hypothetical protein BRAFLDRAFT_91329 [Branchiostoma floridae]
MSSEKLLHVSEVAGRARRDRPGAARPVTVAVAAVAGVLVVVALVFLAHEVKFVRENSTQLKDQILTLKDRTLAMEIKQDAAARDKEEASSHKEEVTALKIQLSSLQTQLDSERAELQKEKAGGASLRERLAVLETKFQLGVGNKQEQTYGTSHEVPSGVLRDRPDETGGTAVMVFPGRRVLLVDVEGLRSSTQDCHNYRDILAQSICTAITDQPSFVFAIRRDCSPNGDGLTCNAMCTSRRAAMIAAVWDQGSTSECFDAIHVYGNRPVLSSDHNTDAGKVGPAAYRYLSGGCTWRANNCGPNYCCCRVH